jgi:hypothetical protein
LIAGTELAPQRSVLSKNRNELRRKREEGNDGPTVRVAGGGRVVLLLLLLHPLGGPLLPDLFQLPQAQQKS